MPKLPEVDISPEEVHSWLNTAVMTQGAEALERAGYKVTEYARQTDESIVSLGRYIADGMKGSGMFSGRGRGGGAMENAYNNPGYYDDAGTYHAGALGGGRSGGGRGGGRSGGWEKKTKAPEQGYNTDPIPPDFFDK